MERAVGENWFRLNRVWYWGPVAAYGTAIFIQSANPSLDSLPVFPYGDKVFHLLGYGLLGVLAFRAFAGTFPRWKKGGVLLGAILLATLYGVSDEIHQFFVPSRTADILDVAADGLGGVLGSACFYLMSRTMMRKEMHP